MTTPLQPGAFVTPTVRLVRPLAEGGMGRVWVAEHLGLHTEVVVKLMADQIAARSDGAERFSREAAAAAAIKSPHVVQIFDHGQTAEGTPYIVMELLEGRDLGAYLTEHGRMPPDQVARLVMQIGKALARAHHASIIHRDIKPDNIFLCDEAARGGERELFVKLLDFGTAKHASHDASRTLPGEIMGTPYYMSPEQSVGAEVDERSDIWSLGVVAFEALTGKKPFDGPSINAIRVAIYGVTPRMTELAPELPPEVDAWFARACAQLQVDRFSNVREATHALVEALTGAAPVDQGTESVFFPPVATSGGSTPVRPITRSVRPLSETLPQRNEIRTKVAAGAVMAAAALAMIGIVLGRSSSGEDGGAKLVAEAPAAARAPEIPPPAAPPAEPAPPAHAAATPKAAAPRTGPVAPAGAPVLPPAAPHTAAKASSKRPPHTAAPSAGKDAGVRDDDDLARLRSAAAPHTADPPPEPKPVPPSAEPKPPPLPAPTPEP